MSRRTFLRGGGATLALLTLAPAAWARSTRVTTGNALTRSRFTPHVGAKFRMSGGGPDVDVVLTEINNLVPVLQSHDPNRFALLFEARADQPPAEGIRTLHQAALGALTLYVSSVDRGVDARHYEAVINR
ncbi:MAG: hypothetical protein M3071_14470 [Actinomycetota bacterium]|nr:hypothetical protein [Actinomycetota bacterium]